MKILEEREELYLNTELVDNYLLKENINRADLARHHVHPTKSLVKNLAELMNTSITELLIPKMNYGTYTPPASSDAYKKNPKKNRKTKTHSKSYARDYVGYLRTDILEARLKEINVSKTKMRKIIGFSGALLTFWQSGERQVLKSWGDKICLFTGLSHEELFSQTLVNKEKTEEIKNTKTVNATNLSLKPFTGNNVMDNMSILNENILTLGNMLINLKSRLDEHITADCSQFDEISKAFTCLLERTEKTDEIVAVPTAKVKIAIADAPQNVINCAKSYNEEDSLETYKNKINKMIKFLSQKNQPYL